MINGLKLNEFSRVDQGATSSDLVAHEFRMLGCQVEVNERLVFAKIGNRIVLTFDSETSYTSRAGTRLLKNKALARQFLKDAGLQVAQGRFFVKDQKSKARQYVEQICRGVVKPVDGNHGNGVSVDVSVEEFDTAWNLAAVLTRSGVLIEEYFTGGSEARYLVVGGKCVGVLVRLPPTVVGDGVKSIGDLVRTKNKRKRTIPCRQSHLIKMDKHRLNMLEKQGLSLSSVLADGEQLIIDTKAGLSTGGDAYEITDIARPELKQIAEKVAAIAPGLDVIGVDILANDHIDTNGALDYIIVEANTRPDLSGHRFPDYGTPKNVHREVAEHCYKTMGFEVPKPKELIDASLVRELTPDVDSASAQVSDEITIVFGGDTSLGDSYISKQKNAELKTRLQEAPLEFFHALAPLFSDKSHFTLNFESVLAHSATDPWGGKKKYLGLDDPLRTVSTLKSIGVNSVSLANNHSMDFGAQPFLETLDLLNNSGIKTFGAGRNSAESLTPLTLTTHLGNVYVFGGFEFRRSYQKNFSYYSGRNRPGVQRFRLNADNQVANEIRTFRDRDPNAFIIVFPHWGGAKNYCWANEKMLETNTSFIRAGADIVLGHGAHMMQQCWVEDSNTTVFSLGNFVFNSRGRYQKIGAPPFSFVARLKLKRVGEQWAAGLRLYPIVSDNLATNYQPRPVSEKEMIEVCNTLAEQGQRVFQRDFAPGQDQRGFFLERIGKISKNCV